MKTVIRDQTVDIGGGKLRYRLRLADGGSRTRYDLMLTHLPQTGNATSCLLCDIAYDYDAALAIFELFARETVSPCHAAEVYDLLCERSEGFATPRIAQNGNAPRALAHK